MRVDCLKSSRLPRLLCGRSELPISRVAGVVGGMNTAIWRSGVYDGLKKLKELVEGSIWTP